jgi:hypothetical protein
MTTLMRIVMIAAVLGLGACSGSDATSSTSSEVVSSTAPPVSTTTQSQSETSSAETEEPAKAGGFTGQDARNYEMAKELCESFPPSQIAKEYGLSPHADLPSIAEGYAHGYRLAFRQGAFEGCLAGL